MSIASTINLNSTAPAAPAGNALIVFQSDGGSPTVNVSAYVPEVVGDTGSGGTGGIVPAPPAGSAAAGEYLRADGTWAAPSVTRATASLAPSAGGNFTVAHALGKTPSAVVIEMTSGGQIWFQSPTAYDGSNLYLVASDAGVTATARCIA